MARRATTIDPEFPSDPIAEVIREERSNTASDLAEALESFHGVDHGNVKGILYKTARGGGKFEWIKEVYPPFDHNEIFTDLQKRFGGGDFQLRMMVNGKIATNINFSIVFDPNAIARETPKNDNNDMTMMMFQMMMKQSDDAARQRADDMRDRQAASERQMTLMATMATAIIPALLGGREKTSELMQAIAAMQPKPPENDLEKTVTTFAALKNIFKDDAPAPSFDPSDMVGSIVKAAGPMAAAVGKAFSGNRGGQVPSDQAPQYEPAAEPLRIAPNPTTPQIEGPKTQPANPLLALIAPDISYHFARRNNPEFAAEGVYDIIVRANVSDDEINALAAAFTLSPDWLADLAAEGIDLRPDPAWANAFLAELVRLHTEDGEHGDDIAGDGGGAANPGQDGEAIPAG